MTKLNFSNKAGEVVKSIKVPETVWCAVSVAATSAGIGVVLGAALGLVRDVKDLVTHFVKKK